MIRNYLIGSLIERGFNPPAAAIAADGVLETVEKAGYRLITKDRYDEWRGDSFFLSALEAHGVDNWEGWDTVVEATKENR